MGRTLSRNPNNVAIQSNLDYLNTFGQFQKSKSLDKQSLDNGEYAYSYTFQSLV